MLTLRSPLVLLAMVNWPTRETGVRRRHETRDTARTDSPWAEMAACDTARGRRHSTFRNQITKGGARVRAQTRKHRVTTNTMGIGTCSPKRRGADRNRHMLTQTCSRAQTRSRAAAMKPPRRSSTWTRGLSGMALTAPSWVGTRHSPTKARPPGE